MNIEFKWIKKIGPVIEIIALQKKIWLCACHRDPSRSIWFFGLERFFCARCCGIIFGFGMGLLLRLAQFSIPVTIFVLFILPLIVDGTIQLFGFRESNNLIRFLTGTLFGIACAMLNNK
jgi:uncharacterized membrane protein